MEIQTNYLLYKTQFNIFILNHCGPMRAMTSLFLRVLYYIKRRSTVGRTHLDESSARLEDPYLTIQYSQQTDIHATRGIRTHNLSRRAVADLCLRMRGHWDRL